MFTKQTIRDIDLRGKTVLLHAELDAPLSADGATVTSDFRVKSSLPTIQALLAQNCKIVLISKLGRPGGKPNPKMSLLPVAALLQKLLKHDVNFVTDCVGEKVQNAAAQLQPGQIILLENLRFHAEEEQNDEQFARSLAVDTGAEVFVQDCFALAHRIEAGTDAITRFLPSVAGLSLEKEVNAIASVMENPEKPLLAIVGGAKIADKIDILKRFIELADAVAIGGAMANTFLAAQGIDVADSLYDKDKLDEAREILAQAKAETAKRGFSFLVPSDGVAAATLETKAATRVVEFEAAADKLRPEEKILDIGPASAARIADIVKTAQSAIWNGTMGVTEIPARQGPVGPFAGGTEKVIEALIGETGHKPRTFVGGGDTAGYVEERKLISQFWHVSTGGGASLDLMSGRPLPGVEALLDKK